MLRIGQVNAMNDHMTGTQGSEKLPSDGRAELVAAIEEGIVSADRGELKPAAQVLAEMEAKFGCGRRLEP